MTILSKLDGVEDANAELISAVRALYDLADHSQSHSRKSLLFFLAGAFDGIQKKLRQGIEQAIETDRTGPRLVDQGGEP